VGCLEWCWAKIGSSCRTSCKHPWCDSCPTARRWILRTASRSRPVQNTNTDNEYKPIHETRVRRQDAVDVLCSRRFPSAYNQFNTINFRLRTRTLWVVPYCIGRTTRCRRLSDGVFLTAHKVGVQCVSYYKTIRNRTIIFIGEFLFDNFSGALNITSWFLVPAPHTNKTWQIQLGSETGSGFLGHAWFVFAFESPLNRPLWYRFGILLIDVNVIEWISRAELQNVSGASRYDINWVSRILTSTKT